MKFLARVFLVLLATTALMLGQWGTALGQTQGLSFDHTTTGFFINSTHKTLLCESCHTSGVFRGTPRTCATCHAGPGSRAPGKSATHIPTPANAPCDICHQPEANSWSSKPTGFTQGGSGHPINPLLGVTPTNCQTCHNGAFVGANALTKPLTHIQTASACSTCHTTTAWIPATNPHAGVVTGTCATCHNGTHAPGKNADHIPTSASCDLCHKTSNFAAWSPVSMDHAGSAGQCSTCHVARYASQGPDVKQAKHISTNLQCDNCHLSTVSWVITFNHDDPNMRPPGKPCAECHNGTTDALSPSATHIPTATAACDSCHSSTSFISFKPAQMSHSAVTSTPCATCHSGGYVSANALAKSGKHVPTTMKCDSCHTQGFVSWSPAVMSHAGLDGQCASCHSGGYLAQNAQSKPTSHISTSAQCDTCHNSTTTWATGVFNHAAATPSVAGRCSTCHTGQPNQGLGKPTNHIPTTAQCDTCHKTFASFALVAMDHAGTAGKCSSCHNGNFVFANALAKPALHIPSGAQCDACHTGGFKNWSPAVMDHNVPDVKAQACSTCHSGTYVSVNAQIKPVTHVSTTAECSTCHKSTATWATAIQDHSKLSPPVSIGDHTCGVSCHNGTPDRGLSKPSTHIPTTAFCDTCHTTFSAFRPAKMDHTSVTSGSCAICHGGAYVSQNALAKPTTHIPTAAACDTCHAGYTAWAPVTFTHTSGNLAGNGCSNCHNNVNAQGKPGSHVPVSEQCDSCHKGGFVNWLQATMDHELLSVKDKACSSCHSGAYLSQNAQTKPTSHVLTTADCASSGCHASKTTWSRGTSPIDHLLITGYPGSVIGKCGQSCHNGSLNKGLSKPTTHIPTTGFACDTCHKNFASFAPASMDHTGTKGNCSSCHSGGYTAVNAQAKPLSHVSTTAQCDTCHNSTSAWGLVTYVHVASTSYGQCDTCHKANGTAQGMGTGHIPSGSLQCDTCHNNFVSFKPAKMAHTPAVIGQCNTCHNSTYASKNALPMPTTHIQVTEQCDSCHKNGYSTWSPAVMDHSLASVVGKRCDSCHGGAYVAYNAQIKPATHVSTSLDCASSNCHSSTTTWSRGTASFDHTGITGYPTSVTGKCGASCHNGSANLGLSKPTTHIPTTGSCDSCHATFTAFAPAQMNHAGTANQCSTCHSGAYKAINAQVKTANHITTTQSCDVCHATTAWKPTTYKHQGVVAGSCATCHDGTKAMGKSFAHIPTVAACDSCHKNYAAFAPAQMNHAGLSGQCTGCHTGAYVLINAQVKPPTHTGTTAQCDTCHTSTTSWATASFDHSAATPTVLGRCSDCHDGAAIPSHGIGKPTNHVPTTAQCDTCHLNFVAFNPAKMNHAGTSGKCSTCHSGSHLFANAQAKSVNHVPVTEQCDSCHKNGFVNWSPSVMDHSLPSVSGQACATCHGGAYLSQNAQTKPVTHVPTTLDCGSSNCHSSKTTWSRGTVAFDHTSITGYPGSITAKCGAACHNGTANLGLSKPTTHIPTTGAACDSCHKNFTAFAPANMDHTAVTATACATCHGGSYTALNAQAKSATHIPTGTQACSVCHSTAAWKPTTYTHSGVAAGSCATCHNGTNARGKTTAHIPTTAACDSCHKNFGAFAPAQMNHTGLNGQCATCHSGAYLSVNAQMKPTTHSATTAQCDTCHKSTTSWSTNLSYVHAASITIGGHACSTCHGVSALGKSTNHVPTTGFCDSCHKNFIAFTPAAMDHAGTTGQCSTCHGGAYTALNALAKPVSHIPVTDQCDTCHKNSAFVTWSPSTMDHNQPSVVAQTCTTCHGGGYLSQNAQTKPATHVPTSLDCASSNCHSSKTTWSRGTSPINHTAITGYPGSVTGKCGQACHNGTANLGLSKPTTHIPTTGFACDSCHKIFTAFTPAVMDHTAVTTTACATCHGGGYTALNAQAKPTTHIPTGTQACSVCHGTATWKPTSFAHTGVLAGSCATCHNGTNALGKTSTHIPTALACDVCHKKTDTSFTQAVMVHTATAGQCSSCHSGTYVAVNALAKPGSHVSTTVQCDTCHKDASFTSWANPTYTHPASATGTCSNCHNGSVLGAQSKLNKPGHVSTTAQCDTCHKSMTVWTGAAYTHAASATGTCSTCHNGSIATGKPTGTGHIPTTAQCDTCHKIGTTFLPAVMKHTGTTGQCLTCHNGSYTAMQAVGKPNTGVHPGTTASCDACHSTTAWSPTSFDHTTAQVGGKACAAAGCHDGKSATGKPALHIPTQTSESCGVCHHTGVAWMPLITPYNHTGVTAACSTCHVISYPGMDYKPANHVPTNATCDTCHIKTNWITADFKHTGVVIGCNTCHTGTYLGVKGKHASHVPTTLSGLKGDDCVNCHSSTAVNGFTTEKMNHNVMQTGCKACHNTGSVYDIGQGRRKTLGNHEGSKATDDCSKSGCHRPLGNEGSTYSSW